MIKLLNQCANWFHHHGFAILFLFCLEQFPWRRPDIAAGSQLVSCRSSTTNSEEKHFKWLSRAASSYIDRNDILRAGVSVIHARKLRTKSRLFPCIRSGSKKGLSLARSPKVRTIYWDTSFAIFANILPNVRSLTQETNTYNATDLCFSLQKQTTASIIKKYARITPLKWKPTWVFLFHPCMDFRPCAQSVARGDLYIRKANNFITPCVIFPRRPLFLSLSPFWKLQGARVKESQ